MEFTFQVAIFSIFRKFLTLGAAAGLFVAGSLVASEASAAACRQTAEPVDVTMSLHRAEVQINHTLSQEKIQKLSGAALIVDGRKSVVRGLTAVQAGYSSHARTKILATGDKFCATIVQLRLEFGFPERTVYIPNSYKRGSCEYDAVLAHERRHLEANDAALQKFAPQFESAVENAVADINPILIGSQDEAREKPLQILEAKLRPALKKFEKMRRDMHAGIDTQSEYRRVHSRCNDW